MLAKKTFLFLMFFSLFFCQVVLAQGMRETLKFILCNVILYEAVRLYNLMILLAPFFIVFFGLLWVIIHTIPPNDTISQIKEGAKRIGVAMFWIYCSFLILFLVFSTMGVMQWVGTFGKDMFTINCN